MDETSIKSTAIAEDGSIIGYYNNEKLILSSSESLLGNKQCDLDKDRILDILKRAVSYALSFSTADQAILGKICRVLLYITIILVYLYFLCLLKAAPEEFSLSCQKPLFFMT